MADARKLIELVREAVHAFAAGLVKFPAVPEDTNKSHFRVAPSFLRDPVGSQGAVYTVETVGHYLKRTQSRGGEKRQATEDVRLAIDILAEAERRGVEVNVILAEREAAKATRVESCYFIECGPGGHKRIKIGKTVLDVADRLRGLTTGAPWPVRVLGHTNRATEAELHMRFAHLRAHLEWFEDSPELRAEIKRLCAK
jgi:hypothetical protein